MFSFVTQSNAPIASQRCHNTRALDLSTYFIDDPNFPDPVLSRVEMRESYWTDVPIEALPSEIVL